MMMKRRRFFRTATITTLSSLLLTLFAPSSALAINQQPSKNKKPSVVTTSSTTSITNGDATIANGEAAMNAAVVTTPTVAYRPMLLDMSPTAPDVKVPVAMWYPIISKENNNSEQNEFSSSGKSKSGGLILEFPRVAFALDDIAKQQQQTSSSSSSLTYNHKISIRRIGQLIAGWDFIPEFLSRRIPLEPSSLKGIVTDGTNLEPPKSGKVVFLAHGYLGSRFDLSHIAEALAQEGFICVSPEYPESLAASYERGDDDNVRLDRKVITDKVLEALTTDMGDNIESFGFVGHSFGCATALEQSDDNQKRKWTRVLMAGSTGRQGRMEGPSLPQPNILLIVSKNDGVTSRFNQDIDSIIPEDYVRLDEDALRRREVVDDDDKKDRQRLPSKAALIMNRPNHISFLNDGVNQAMLNVLSPLLPIAQTLKLPVLDFDKYQQSQDAKETAHVIVPLITQYLKQEM